MRQALAALLLGFSSALACEAGAQGLPAAERRAVVAGAAELIEARYVYPERGRRIARDLRGRADGFTEEEPEAFAQALTDYLRAIAEDGHFAVEYIAHGQGADADGDAAYDAAQMERYYGAAVNHGFEAVRRLEGGVGLLDLRVFAPTDMAGDLAMAAMSLLAQSPALIIDLRRNGGGHGDMADLLQAYLFEHSVETSATYDRPSDTLTRSFTPAWVPGRRFGPDKPVFILISNRTFSAAEGFAYDLQARGRATVVGERSGGGAHPFAYRAITPRFVISLPESRSINPITGGDWQGVGVRPDVETPADEALDVALRLAQEAIAASR